MFVVISAMVFVNHYLAFDFFSSVWYPFSEVQFLFVAFLCVLFRLQAEMLVDTHKSLYPYSFPLLCTKWDTLKKKMVFVGEQRWCLLPMWPRFEPPSSTPYMGLIFCWFSPLPESERLFSRYSGFPLFLETNTSKCKFDLQPTDTFQRVLKNFHKCSAGKQNNTIYKLPHHDAKITNWLNFIQHDVEIIIIHFRTRFFP